MKFLAEFSQLEIFYEASKGQQNEEKRRERFSAGMLRGISNFLHSSIMTLIYHFFCMLPHRHHRPSTPSPVSNSLYNVHIII
jgi:hypothetical protein